MGRISSGVGLVSGINSKDIIDQLMALESRPKDLLQTRIDGINQQKLAYTDLTTRLAGLKVASTTLKKTSTFQAATATSSDEDVLTATAENGAAVGSFQLQVARLVTSQQTISRGFADFNSTKLSAGTITIDQGGGELTQLNPLSSLNGGAGVHRGIFRITDRSGASAVIDITAAVNLQDVIKKINTSLGVQVHAQIDGDHLVIADVSGKTDGNLIIQDLADGTAASELGIVQNVSANTITGTSINSVGRDSTLGLLNDGRGVRTVNDFDFSIQPRDGSTAFKVNLATARTLGDAVDLINAASGGKVKASIVDGAKGITLTDQTAGAGALTVTALNGSSAAADLGIAGSVAGSTLTGQSLIASLGTVLLSSLNGGNGITLGTLSIHDRAGADADVDLSSAKTVQDVLDAINNAPGLHVKASLKASGNGISISSISGSGDLIISSADATAATLGLGGTFDSSIENVEGANLHRQYVSSSTLLSDFNGGKGVTTGKIKITNSKGVAATISLNANQVSIGDVMAQINARQIGVTASINANGNGLLLTDAAGGALKLKVEDVDSTTAADLNIKGTATGATIDGSFEKTIDVTANDTLATVQQKINDLNFGVTASIINDGTGLAPFRLSLGAKNPGLDGRVVLDAGSTGLETRNLIEAQDAAVFLGGAESEQPLLITASHNQITGVLKGVTINLNGVSDKPVSLNVSRSVDQVVDQIKQFAQGFNDLTDKIAELTKFDTDTNTRGLLLGDDTVQTIQTQIYAALSAVVPNNGAFRILADVGISLGDGAKITFDEDKFRAAYAQDPDAVQTLFTTPEPGVSSNTLLNQLNAGRGLRRAPSGDDFHVELHDGTALDISLAAADTMRDVLATINAESPTKLKVELTSSGALKVSDLTSGTGSFALSSLNGSQALADLGLSTSAVGNDLIGQKIQGPQGSVNAGVAVVLETRISNLIDPVNGAITRENQTLDERTVQFQDRMGQLDKLLENKRTRLERQFANLESVLAGLQNQQQALGSIQSIQPVRAPQSSSTASH
jgi:flagellar hook-associated protein 2